MELADRALTDLGSLGSAFRHSALPSWSATLAVDDDEMLAGMRSGGRRDVRRGLRNGITVEEVDPSTDPGFAAEYHTQVTAAFAKRGQVPPYPPSEVEAMVRHLHPTGRLLLLRARTPEGEPAATALAAGPARRASRASG